MLFQAFYKDEPFHFLSNLKDGDCCYPTLQKRKLRLTEEIPIIGGAVRFESEIFLLLPMAALDASL